MLLETLSAFDGHTLNGATSYGAELWLTHTVLARATQPQYIARRNAPPVLDSVQPAPVQLVVMLRALNTSASRATFINNVEAWFTLSQDDTLRTLTGATPDGTAASMDVAVVGFEFLADNGTDVMSVRCRVTFESPSGYAKATSATTASSSPIVNGGSLTARPSVAFTSAVNKTERVCTVSGAGYGGGMTAIPVRFALADTAATSTNVFVYVNNVSVPCLVAGSGLSTSAVFALIDTASDGSNTNVVIVYGSGLVNPLCGQLSDGGMIWNNSTTTGTSNTVWRWDDLRVSNNPRKRPGVWYPAQTGIHLYPNTTVAFTEAAGQLDMTIGADGSGLRYDSIVMIVPPGAGATTALAANGLNRVTNGSFANARMFLRYKVAGNPAWIASSFSTTTASQTTATGVDLDDAIMIAVGVESTSATLAPAGAGSVVIGSLGVIMLTLANGPTVSIAAAANLDYYNGAFQIGSGPTLTFTDFMTADGTLTVDAETGLITHSVAGSPFFGTLTTADDGPMLTVAPGSNAITNGTGGSYTVTIHASYT